ncbi:hypothetical protein [Mesorhizobium sp. B2-8-9]|uniref:hypothetical protein n=1 Tax=Mesorhizobium sp. B2-8-9 TaxID=2589899 RepID=UPI0032B24C69
MAEHLPNAMTDDPVAVSDLAGELMKAAEREGIPAGEINEEVDSVVEVIFEALENREGSLPRRALARDQPESVGIHCDGHTKIDGDLAIIDPGEIADQLNFLALLHLRRAIHNGMWLAIGGDGNAYPVLRDTPAHFGPNDDLIANVERAFAMRTSLEREVA